MALGLLAQTSLASAHPLVDAGVEAAYDGRFDDALAAFEGAWRADGLARADVITLLVERAIVRFALRDTAELDQDLRLLVALDHAFVLPQRVPPQVRRRFEQIRAEPRAEPTLAVTVGFTARTTTFETRVAGLPEALVLRVRISARPARGQWASGEGPHVELPIAQVEAVEWYAEVLGPGGAVLLAEGDATSPRRATNPTVLVAASVDAAPSGPSDDRGSRKGLWWGVGGGAAAIVLGTVLFVVIHDPSRDTYVADPVIR